MCFKHNTAKQFIFESRTAEMVKDVLQNNLWTRPD